MTQTSPLNQDISGVSTFAKKCQLFAAAMLGVGILLVVGFSPISEIHNATHDTRHSTGFPCH